MTAAAPNRHSHYHMDHPGPIAQNRFATATAAETRHARGTLQPGQTLHDAVFNLARRYGTSSGAISLSGGSFSKLSFTTGGPDRHNTGKAANFTWIRNWDEAHIISGEIAFGLCEAEGGFVHCHAMFSCPDQETPQPVIGGHLMCRDCVISEPVAVIATLYSGFGITRQFDPETTHSIFEPAAEHERIAMDDTVPATARPGRFGRVFFIRLRPNEDLVAGLEAACASLGLNSAQLRGSIGSVNRPVFDIGGGRCHEVEKIGLEIVSLKGSVTPGSDGGPQAELTGALVDDAGLVSAGRFIRGKAPICITAEICIEEWIPDQPGN